MTIKILEDLHRIAMTDANDIRSFIAGEIHELRPEHERHLIDLGAAEPVNALSPESDTPALTEVRAPEKADAPIPEDEAARAAPTTDGHEEPAAAE